MFSTTFYFHPFGDYFNVDLHFVYIFNSTQPPRYATVHPVYLFFFSTQKAEDLVTKKHRSNNKERLPPSRTNIAPEQNRPSPKGKLQRNNLQHLCFEGVFSFLKEKTKLATVETVRGSPPQKKKSKLWLFVGVSGILESMGLGSKP